MSSSPADIVELADSEAALALFAEGIAGRYYHIKASSEFHNPRQLWLGEQLAGQTQDALYLPETLDAPSGAAFRVLVLEQLGQRECGTYQFRIDVGRERLPDLAARYREPRGITSRSGDYYRLFACFDQPSLAAELLMLFERSRIQAHLLRTYPGIRRHMSHYHQHLLDRTIGEDPLTAGQRWLWGATVGWPVLIDALMSVQSEASSVYDSVAGLCRVYDAVAAAYVLEPPDTYAPEQETLTDWLGREERVEEWQEDLDQLNEHILALDYLEAEELDAKIGDSSAGAVREANVDIKSLVDERDNLKRRLDMEQSSLQHALGIDRSDARSFRYDEWDYLVRHYRRHWCRVYEMSLADEDADPSDLMEVIQRFEPQVRKQLAHIRRTGLVRVKPVADGDELEPNAMIQARQDIRAGLSPDERVYSRKERAHRDVGAVFLIDLSASTDDPIEPPEPVDWSNYQEDDGVNLRDPWEPIDDAPEQTPRKIIDVQREAMAVMCAALDALGDSYAIYGFSGYGRDCVELFVAKEAQQAFGVHTLKAIAAMAPKRSTRMGPAIRHSVQRLLGDGHAIHVLIILSDGFPQDCDYGPERGDHEYGVQDTAKAIAEAQQKGVETFCLTVDKSGHDYLRVMCPDSRYMIIEEMEDLPAQLTKVYAGLTGR